MNGQNKESTNQYLLVIFRHIIQRRVTVGLNAGFHMMYLGIQCTHAWVIISAISLQRRSIIIEGDDSQNLESVPGLP